MKGTVHFCFNGIRSHVNYDYWTLKQLYSILPQMDMNMPKKLILLLEVRPHYREFNLDYSI